MFRSVPLADPGDKDFPPDRAVYVVWAMGRLDSKNEPSFHDTYSKANVKVMLSPPEPTSNCFSFTTTDTPVEKSWEKRRIFNRSLRTFNAYVGPSGGKKGYQATTGTSN